MFTGDSEGERRHKMFVCIFILLDEFIFNSKIYLIIYLFFVNLGQVHKWEQMQSNQIMYSSERLLKFEGKKDLKDVLVQPISLGDTKKEDDSHKSENSTDTTKRVTSANRIKTVDERLPAYYVRSRSAAKIREKERGIGGYVSQYAHLKKREDTTVFNAKSTRATGKSVLRMLFVERYDLIVAACEDWKIYVWGFDQEALKALTTLRDQSVDINAIAEGRSLKFYLLFVFVEFV